MAWNTPLGRFAVPLNRVSGLVRLTLFRLVCRAWPIRSPSAARCTKLSRQPGRAIAEKVLDTVSNAGTDAVNGGIKKTRGLAQGFRNFTNYRIRVMGAADGSRPYRRSPKITPEPC